MKIALIIDTLTAGGKQRRFIELIKGLRKNCQIEIDLILLSRTIHYVEVLQLDIDIHYLERRSNKDPLIFSHLYRLFKSTSPDIVQSWDSMSSVYAAPVAKLLGIKFINAMVYDAPDPLKAWSPKWTRAKFTFPLSTAIVGNSQAGLDAYQAPAHKSFLIPNGFDFKRLEGLPVEDIKRKFSIKTDKIVGMVATFSHHKDHKTFLTAAQSILATRQDVSFVCIGGTKYDYLDKAKALVRKDFSDRALFLGPQNPVEPIINIFTVGVLTTYTEGISNAIMEYMALGKPVIATDGGGTRELVLDNETGYLIERENPKQLENYLNYLLDNPELATQMGKAGKRRIEEAFSIYNMISSFNNLYKEILE